MPDALKDAVDGIATALSDQPNFRLQVFIAAIALALAAALRFKLELWAILVALIGFVLTAELFNTALERTVDLIEPDTHPLARAAKHAGAGAVLTASVTALLVGVWLYGRALHLW